jgi:hypothetical protein
VKAVVICLDHHRNIQALILLFKLRIKYFINKTQ